MTLNKTREDWAAQLSVGHWLNVSTLTISLADILSIEAKPLEVTKLESLLLSGVDPQHIHHADFNTYCALPIAFERYGDWMLAIAGLLGIDTSDHDVVDEWIDDSMPMTQNLLWGLLDLISDYMASASESYRKEHGFSPADVFVGSLNSGESVEQTKTRLSFASKGIKPV